MSFGRNVWISERDGWIAEASEAFIILKSELFVSSIQTNVCISKKGGK